MLMIHLIYSYLLSAPNEIKALFVMQMLSVLNFNDFRLFSQAALHPSSDG